MSTSRTAALDVCRRHLRGFAGAPDPRRHAQGIYSELIHADGWSPTEEAVILAFGAWLSERPGLRELKPRCEKTLAALKTSA